MTDFASDRFCHCTLYSR